MTDSVPPEILDYILDFLQDDPKSLKQCCLVAKSWVPRTRRYLFADISFHAADLLESWSNTFPDPKNSPAPHVRTLEIGPFHLGDLEGVDWIRSFSYVVELCLNGDRTLPFALFQGFSHLKSLKMPFIKLSCSELFRFICFFPLLENLDLIGKEVSEDDANAFHGLQTSPPLTGTLSLIVLNGGMRSIPRHLLNLPNGLHFRELELYLNMECDLRWIRELVLRCSNTLECLDIKYGLSEDTPNSVDLSQVTKLKVLKVWMRNLSPGRLIVMLETITAEHRDFRQISIDLPGMPIPQLTDEKWLVLDRLLVRFWESYSIRTKVLVTWGDRVMKGRISTLLPEMTARGIVDMPKY